MDYLFDDVYDDSFDLGMEGYMDDVYDYDYDYAYEDAYIASNRASKGFLYQIASESFNEGYDDAMIAMEGATINSLKKVFEQLKAANSEGSSISSSDKMKITAFIYKYEGQIDHITSIIQGGKKSIRNLKIASVIIMIEFCISLLAIVTILKTLSLLNLIGLIIRVIIGITIIIIRFIKLNHTQKVVNEAKKLSNELKRFAESNKNDPTNTVRLSIMATKLDDATKR